MAVYLRDARSAAPGGDVVAIVAIRPAANIPNPEEKPCTIEFSLPLGEVALQGWTSPGRIPVIVIPQAHQNVALKTSYRSSPFRPSVVSRRSSV